MRQNDADPSHPEYAKYNLYIFCPNFDLILSAVLVNLIVFLTHIVTEETIQHTVEYPKIFPIMAINNVAA